MFKPQDLVYYKCQACRIECVIDRGPSVESNRRVALLRIGPKRLEVPLEQLKK